MAIEFEEITEKDVYRAWKITIDDQLLILKRIGKTHCCWDKLVLERDGKEVYRVELKGHFGKNGEDQGERTEYFNGKYSGFYKGNQVSFIEYISFMGEGRKPQNKNELIGFSSQMLIDFYQKKADQILKGN